ncbi:MAG: arylsulfatase [bacterium]|nr:arylsulfatase [bacterium]
MKEDRDSRPNVVLILADDLGWGDIGAYGSEIRTPNLDGLARKGLRFTQMYNSARCCPTRAALLTGLHPHQAGIGHMVVNMGVPSYQGYLNDSCVTIAEVLKGSGYRTLMAGKWHVGGEQANLPEDWYPDMPGYPTPMGRGFDRFYGILSGGGNYYNPNMLMDGTTRMCVDTLEYHFTDAISEKAAQFVEDASHRDEPFFLFLAYTAPHWPLHAWPEDIERYRGTYRKGWDALRTQRHEEQKGAGLLDVKWPIAPREQAVPDWEAVDEKEWRDLQMAVYAAQIEQMDRGIGQVLEVLKERGIEDNTIVMFLSDNGGCAEFLQEDSNDPDPSKYNHPTVDGREVRVGNAPSILPGPDDSFCSVDMAWANASNAPFRLFKRYTHEGGISTPFIVSWPDGIQTPGLVREPSHIIDVMPTLVAVTGVTYPGTYNGQDILPMAGESFAEVFEKGDWSRQGPIFWEHEGNRAVRVGEWKLVSEVADPSDASSRAVWELYNMTEDRTELNDWMPGEQGRANDMIKLYNTWAERCGVLLWPVEGAPRPMGMDVLSRHNHSVRVPSVRFGPKRVVALPGGGS